MKEKHSTEMVCWTGTWLSLTALLKQVIDPDSNSPVPQESYFTKISTFSLVSKSKYALFLVSGSVVCLSALPVVCVCAL